MPGETVAANIVAVWCYVMALVLNRRGSRGVGALLLVALAALAVGVAAYVQ